MSSQVHSVLNESGERVELTISASEVQIGSMRFATSDLYDIELRRPSRKERDFLFFWSTVTSFAGYSQSVPLTVLTLVCLVGITLRVYLRDSRWVVGQVKGDRLRYLFRTRTPCEAQALARMIQESR